MRTALVTILMMTSILFSACSTRNTENEMQDKPFKGVWEIVNEPEIDEPTRRMYGAYTMVLAIDFYEKSVDNGIEKTHGGFFVENDRGGGDCEITSFTIDGNKAYIEYEDPSTIIFSATLVYSPSDKTMTFIDGDVVDMQEASQSMIAQFHYLQQESVLQPSKGDNNQNQNTIEEKKEPMGTFETILLLILSVGILIGVYYVLKIILGYVLCALLFGFIFGVIGLIAGYFISQPDMFSVAVVAAIIGAVIGLVIGIFGTKEWISSPLANKVAEEMGKRERNKIYVRDQYGNKKEVKQTGKGILGETYYRDEDGNTYQKP